MKSVKMYNILIVIANFAYARSSTLPPQPEFKFDIYNIKTPQLLGIIFGCIVFTMTISSVVYLLYASGTFKRLQQELSTGQPLMSGGKSKEPPQVFDQPELYDHLIMASSKLPQKIVIGSLKSKLITVHEISHSDISGLFDVGNGSAQFHESSYEPERLWGWLAEFSNNIRDNGPNYRPYISLEVFTDCILKSPADTTHCCLVDIKLNKIIGMISLIHNNPRHLSIQIDNLWVTPAYQGKRVAHEAILLVVQSLVDQGYRRITAEVDSRHLIGRKFLERCGFRLEAVLRKHRIVNARNRDSALYVILNSDWLDISIKLKRYLGISTEVLKHKIAEIDTPQEALLRPVSVAKVIDAMNSKGDTISKKEVSDSHGDLNSKKKKKNKKN